MAAMKSFHEIMAEVRDSDPGQWVHLPGVKTTHGWWIEHGREKEILPIEHLGRYIFTSDPRVAFTWGPPKPNEVMHLKEQTIVHPWMECFPAKEYGYPRVIALRLNGEPIATWRAFEVDGYMVITPKGNDTDGYRYDQETYKIATLVFAINDDRGVMKSLDQVCQNGPIEVLPE